VALFSDAPNTHHPLIRHGSNSCRQDVPLLLFICTFLMLVRLITHTHMSRLRRQRNNVLTAGSFIVYSFHQTPTNADGFFPSVEDFTISCRRCFTIFHKRILLDCYLNSPNSLSSARSRRSEFGYFQQTPKPFLVLIIFLPPKLTRR
jgi:hypothetical protein